MTMLPRSLTRWRRSPSCAGTEPVRPAVRRAAPLAGRKESMDRPPDEYAKRDRSAPVQAARNKQRDNFDDHVRKRAPGLRGKIGTSREGGMALLLVRIEIEIADRRRTLQANVRTRI